MKCQNRECKHDFFEKELHYLFCPNCGEAVDQNFPTDIHNTQEAQNAFLRISEFQDYVSWCNNSFFPFLFAIFLLILTAQMFYSFTHDSLRNHHFGSYFISSEMKTNAIMAMILFFIFVSSLGKYNFYKKYMGECIWYCSTIWFKIIKWVLLFFTIMFIIQFVIPGLQNELIKTNVNEHIIKFLTDNNYFNIFTVILVCIATDIEDVYRRKYCIWLNRPSR